MLFYSRQTLISIRNSWTLWNKGSTLLQPLPQSTWQKLKSFNIQVPRRGQRGGNHLRNHKLLPIQINPGYKGSLSKNSTTKLTQRSNLLNIQLDAPTNNGQPDSMPLGMVINNTTQNSNLPSIQPETRTNNGIPDELPSENINLIFDFHDDLFNNSGLTTTLEKSTDNTTLTETVEIPTTFGISKKGLAIASFNIQHISNKLDLLRFLLMQNSKTPDILFILETFLNSSFSDDELSIPGYFFQRKDRTGKQGGGILVYIRNGLSVSRKTNYEVKDLEIIWLELSLPKTKPILIAGVYRPPSTDSATDIKLERNLSQGYFQNKEFYALGDFNINLLHQTATDHKLIRGLHNMDMTQLVFDVTRPLSKSCIDHIWCSNPDNVAQVKVSKIGVSDHFPVCVVRKINSGLTKPKKHITIKYRCYKNFDTSKFLEDLKLVPWDQLQIIESDPDEALHTFEHLLNKVIDEHAPLKERRVKCWRQPPWMSPEILQDMRKRDKLLQLAMKSSGKENRNTAEWKSYRKTRNKVVWAINRNKREYFIASMEENNGNSKKMWKSINSILRRNNKSETPSTIKDKETHIDNSQDIAEAFCNYFSTVANDILDNEVLSQQSNNEELQTFCRSNCPV